MLTASIALGLVAGLVLGGRLERLAELQLRYMPLVFAGLLVRFLTELLIGSGAEPVAALRLPLFALAYGLLLYAVWRNRAYPGLALAFVGIAGNAVAIVLNGGAMPVYLPSVVAAGLPLDEVGTVFHRPYPDLSLEFLLRAGPFGDVIPLPFPWEPLRNVASVGDLFLSAGLAFFLFATVLRTPEQNRRAMLEVAAGRPLLGRRGSRLPDWARSASGVRSLVPPDRATVRAAAVAAAGLAPAGAGAGTAAPGVVLPRPAAPRRPPLWLRARRHPYVGLALNGSFSALWAGQLISLFGDRVNQIALGFFVLDRTDSVVATGLVFVAGALPNLVFSPFAGAYVDRWDQKQVLIVSDILRAACTLLLPVAVLVNVWLVYPLIFAISTISIFFRPARVAVLPRIVSSDDLMAANSAMWVGETIADVLTVPLAGLFVTFLAGSIPLAFWFDAATYLLSASLLATIALPPLLTAAATRGARAADGEGGADDGPAAPRQGILADTRDGWRFLRGEPVLLANTLQGAAGQIALGTVTALMIPYVDRVLVAGEGAAGAYALLEAAIGVGNLAGGFVLGLVAARVAKGRLVIGAYALFGLCITLTGLTSLLPVALGLMFGAGVANMAFVIPSQTLFQERTPPELMGRVVGFRFALVFGAMSLAMGAASVLGELLGPGPVIAGAGLVAVAAGLAGLLVPAVRDA